MENQYAVGLALIAALLFGTGMQFTRLGLRSVDSQRGTLLTIASSTLAYWLAAPWLLEWSYWSSSVVWLFLIVGVFRPFLSSNLSLAGTAMLGPTISSTLSSTAPFFSLTFGVLLLDEELSLRTVLGTVAIVAGVGLLARQRGKQQSGAAWPLWALALPIGAAVIRVAAHLAAKVGMEVIPSAYFVGVVSCSASLLMALANNYRRGTSLRGLTHTTDSWWFVITGVINAAAVFTLNLSLQRGDLSVVGPIVSCEPIFVMLIGALFFHQRNLRPSVIVSVLVVVMGVVLISIR
ncbi:MAG: DME family drug/metabolite transporter [Gammaproteobacteria bacterium]|jgi:DME family drug/metabolite transporter